jgi:mannose-6-phosphate isomerase-like protein (cupin superfamily)
VSYPPPIYHADTPEVSATVRGAGAVPELEYPNGNRVSYLATGTSTGGLFGLYRWDFSDARTGPDPHFHRTMAESFFVLSGRLRIHDGRGWRDAGPGDFLHVPPGGIHGFRNESGEPASMLLHFAPGAPREGYFEGLLRMAEGDKPTPEQYAEFMERHDNIWVE